MKSTGGMERGVVQVLQRHELAVAMIEQRRCHSARNRTAQIDWLKQRVKALDEEVDNQDNRYIPLPSWERDF
ncbi:MAG: hypothetical protein HC910_00005 [Spirulinaceae cyanobacterium SM2_1_0]|nr:hypothetical protein [Spirulinaceae cyanobacterium SM2_1_0]